MILEDPFVGLTVFVSLLAAVTVGRFALPRRSKPTFATVFDGLSDIDDDELAALGAQLRRLPAKAFPRHSTVPMECALQEWRATFDETARQRFIHLAKALLAEYDGGGATPRPS